MTVKKFFNVFEKNIIKISNYQIIQFLTGEFDSGSEQTLAACLIHASRTGKVAIRVLVAHG